MALVLAAWATTGFVLHSPAAVSPAPEWMRDPAPAWMIRNVVRWEPLIERWREDFPDLDTAVVMAVIAQESQGFPEVVSGDEAQSVGLMQVTPRPWTATADELKSPGLNIYIGMWILDSAIKQSDLRTGLAAYNCGFDSLERGNCHSYGGYAYADWVLDYWVPQFERALK